ncbi:MAG: hypothetical protein EOQ55_21090 [Mesorhizobium sp.]|uniref:hypothetical protein n=1 Tax=Mesorhizobium sp. TaxID=1871066 RepID=UPI000FEA99D4|nr:hypothetical protein [Mesorhizobium sp.]RWG16308.1 MAG: hypothetical protein EOQ55_21090 [Mesorhizobium sp.]RWI90070.1 MAG: hypothetical protein EOR21_24155 [Mesorhizobium sp.]
MRDQVRAEAKAGRIPTDREIKARIKDDQGRRRAASESSGRSAAIRKREERENVATKNANQRREATAQMLASLVAASFGREKFTFFRDELKEALCSAEFYAAVMKLDLDALQKASIEKQQPVQLIEHKPSLTI